jgi:hypothetical protein
LEKQCTAIILNKNKTIKYIKNAIKYMDNTGKTVIE